MRVRHVDLTQKLLDRHQPGKDARVVLSYWNVDLLRNERSDIHLLTDFLYDGFCQAGLSMRKGANELTQDANFLLQELTFRYLTKVLGQDFIADSLRLFDQSSAYRNLHHLTKSNLQKIEKDQAFKVIHRDGLATVDAQDQLIRSVYLMGDAKRILQDMGGEKVRSLYPKISTIPGGSSSRLRIPKMEEIRLKIERAAVVVEGFSDHELGVRVIRSISKTHIADYDVETPVYGVKTAYAYAPLIIARLVNGWEFDNAAVVNELSDKMRSATRELTAFNERYNRVSEHSPSL